MFDPNSTHHRCRNPCCKAWLKEPVENRRDAFCCASCEVGFYRTHCRVCEREFGESKRSSRRELCGKRKCINEFRSDRKRAQVVSRYYPLVTPLAVTSKPEKSSTKPTPKTGIKSDLGFTIGADYDREILHANFRVNAKFWNAVALIGPGDPPVNIFGAFKFPNAPKVDLRPTEPAPISATIVATWAPAPASVSDSEEIRHSCAALPQHRGRSDRRSQGAVAPI